MDALCAYMRLWISGPENVSETGDCEQRPEIVKKKPVSNGGVREMLRDLGDAGRRART